jgi:hypothetical protein
VLDIPVLRQPRDKPFQARATGLWLVGHHSVHSRSGYPGGRGLNCSLRFGCPHSPGLAPRLPVCLLTNELPSTSGPQSFGKKPARSPGATDSLLHLGLFPSHQAGSESSLGK